MLVRTSRFICEWAQQTGSSSCLSCLRAPLVLSVHKYYEWGLLLVLLRRIPVLRACMHLLFSLQTITANGVFFSSSQEELLFVVLACASRSIWYWARQTGYSYHPLENNSCSLCSRTPLVLSASDHNKLSILLILLRIIPVFCACARLSFHGCAN